MLKSLTLYLVISLNLFGAIKLDNNTNNIDILQYSSYLIDATQHLNFDKILSLKGNFVSLNQPAISFGYAPKINVWLQIVVVNTTDKTIQKIIEYDNPLTSSVRFYDADFPNTFSQDGLYHKRQKTNINPSFTITLLPNQYKTYYICASSTITTLTLKSKLWNIEAYVKKEQTQQIIYIAFFSAMAVLVIYNLFLYLFIRDSSYLFYLLYLVGILFHHVFYRGFSGLFLEADDVKEIVSYASIIVAMPIVFLAFFTKAFLKTSRYPTWHKILNIYLIFLPFSLVALHFFEQYRNSTSMLLLLYLFAFTLYASTKRNRQAYFILLGWTLFVIAGMSMYFSSIGVINIEQNYHYFVELLLVSEAILFSIALVDRIKTLQKEKKLADEKLLKQVENENLRLEQEVAKSTQKLSETLSEKSVLLSELNHRVKNNLAMIVSLIRLQSDDFKDDKLKEIFLTLEHRLNAMLSFHKLLYQNENSSNVDTAEYFGLICDEILQSINNDISIEFDIHTKLDLHDVIYCGLILNELVTNSCKHAFGKDGTIKISLVKDGELFILTVKDDGKGYSQDTTHDSFGLTLIQTLVKSQLKGTQTITSTNGTQTTITWGEK